jgi:hypothetical protein
MISYSYANHSGFDRYGKGMSLVARYDISKDQWSSEPSIVAPLPLPRGGLHTVQFGNGCILIAGGTFAEAFAHEKSINVYHIATNRYSQAPFSLPFPLPEHSRLLNFDDGMDCLLLQCHREVACLSTHSPGRAVGFVRHIDSIRTRGTIRKNTSHLLSSPSSIFRPFHIIIINKHRNRKS